MKRLLSLLLYLLLPSGANADEAQDLHKFETLHFNANAMGVCSTIDFQVNLQGIDAAIESVGHDLIAAGYTDGTLSYIAEKQVHLGHIESPMRNIPEFSASAEDMKAAMQDFEARFTIAEDRCLDLIKDPFIGYFIKPIGYQITDGPKSFFGLIKYQAEQGDSEKMFLVGSFYDFGVQPDTNHKQEFYWYSKSANAGNANGASMLAGSYFGGRGIPKDIVEAIKWAVIAYELGDDGETLQIIEGKATAKERAEGRKRAVAWLRAH